MVARHNALVALSEYSGQLWVTLYTQADWVTPLCNERKQLVVYFVYSHILAERIIQNGIWHTQNIFFNFFVGDHNSTLASKTSKSDGMSSMRWVGPASL